MLWLATDGGGLIKLDPVSGNYTQWDSASTAGQIPEDNLTHMEFKDGVIWVSTAAEGILKIEGLLVTAIEDQPMPVPVITSFNLYDNFPNPFNPSTTIQFELPRFSQVNLSVYDINGKLVKNLLKGQYQAGNYSVRWNGTASSGENVASGVYVYHLQAEGQQMSKKMVLVR
jgi:hypothetical protein